jgi:hypothetical protein
MVGMSGLADCETCGERFSTDRNFDRHRVGQWDRPAGDPEGRRCLTPTELEAKGLARDPDGVWRERPPEGGFPAAAVERGAPKRASDDPRPTEGR